jgi:hypothetical protein
MVDRYTVGNDRERCRVAEGGLRRRIAVAGEVPVDEYFRSPFLLAGSRHHCETFYIHWRGTSPRVMLTTFAAAGPRTVSCSIWRLPRELAGLDLLLFNYPLRPIAQAFFLKRLLRPRACFWDYFDDYYYGRKTWPKAALTELWQRLCDRVLVLSPTLLSRFSNALRWDNASNLTRKPDSPSAPPTIGTIASLDVRFDRHAYLHLVDALPGYRFHLYGRIHNHRNRDAENVRRYQEWLRELACRPNSRYFGAYAPYQLQAIVSSFDLGLIPYVPGRRCEHLNPDKYYHYTNAGVPVVSAPIPSLMSRDNVVFYSDREDLVAKVRQVANGQPPAPAATRFDWDDRLVEILHALEDVERAAQSGRERGEPAGAGQRTNVPPTSSW